MYRPYPWSDRRCVVCVLRKCVFSNSSVKDCDNKCRLCQNGNGQNEKPGVRDGEYRHPDLRHIGGNLACDDLRAEADEECEVHPASPCGELPHCVRAVDKLGAQRRVNPRRVHDIRRVRLHPEPCRWWDRSKHLHDRLRGRRLGLVTRGIRAHTRQKRHGARRCLGQCDHRCARSADRRRLVRGVH